MSECTMTEKWALPVIDESHGIHLTLAIALHSRAQIWSGPTEPRPTKASHAHRRLLALIGSLVWTLCYAGEAVMLGHSQRECTLELPLLRQVIDD